MDIFLEIINLLFAFIGKLYQDKTNFYQTLVIALFLSGISWIICCCSSRLWNSAFRIKFIHHIICALAAFFTLLFMFSFVALKYTEEVTELIIIEWQDQINQDKQWQKQVFTKTYYEIKNLNFEDFRGYLPPEQGGNIIPDDHIETKKKIATIYANAAVEHFNLSHRYLSKFLWANPDIFNSAY